MRREIYSVFGVPFPQVPGKRVRFFYEDGSSKVTVEVFADSNDFPEWSAEEGRLEQAVIAVCERYGTPVPAFRHFGTDED